MKFILPCRSLWAFVALCLVALATATAEVPTAAELARKYKPMRKVTVTPPAFGTEEASRTMRAYLVASLPEIGIAAAGVGQAEVVDRRDLPCRVQRVKTGQTHYFCSAVLTVKEFGPAITADVHPDLFSKWNAYPPTTQLPAWAQGDFETRSAIPVAVQEAPSSALAAAPSYRPAGAQGEMSLADLTAQLDRLDALDFEDAIDAVDKCTGRRDFDCGSRQLAKAGKLVNSEADRRIFQMASKGLADEKKAYEDERRAEREHEEDMKRLKDQQRRAEREAREADRDINRSSGVDVAGAISAGIASAMAGKAQIDAIHNRAMANINNIVQQRRTQDAQQQRQQQQAEQQLERQRSAFQQATVQRKEANEERQREYAQLRESRQKERDQLRALASAPVAPQVQVQVQVQAQNLQLATATATRPNDVLLPQSALAATAPAAPVAKPKWGPIQLEATAICRQSKKNSNWICNGPLDNDLLFDGSLEDSLNRQSCAGGERMSAGVTYQGERWEAFRCGRSLGAGDNDIATRHGLRTIQRQYICSTDVFSSSGVCTTLYNGQDRR